MLHTSLSFFSQHGFRSITSGPGEIEVFHHSRLIDGNLFYVYHLVDSLKGKELFWVTESEKFSSLEDLMLAYPKLKTLSLQTENKSAR